MIAFTCAFFSAADAPARAQGLPFLGPAQQPPTAGPFTSPAPTAPAALPQRALQMPVNAPTGPGATGGREPHAVLPAPPPGKVALGAYARFGSEGAVIARGIVWRVFSDKPEQSGAFPLVAESAEAAPVFFLNPGGYIVHASYGFANTAERVQLTSASKRQAFLLPAGGLRLQADVDEKTITGQKVTFDIFEGSFLEGRTSSQPYYRGANTGEVVLLPEGTYHVVSTYGDANAVVRADVNVAPGKLSDATMHHRAAQVMLKLVKEKGGEAKADTQWSIITPGGDTIKESIGAFPTVILAEGEYEAIARNDGKSYRKEFTVAPGKDVELEVLMQ